ncbi:MAG: bifunctional UDP-N-acetylglucosamine diphosphorylase/glucosamine-1-phosphate N-acetyltransferase GlmU [Halanaerobiaceae bacterium]
MAELLTLILAAGKGTRMKSELTKVLHEVAGKPMVEHVIDQADEIMMNSKTVCIVGHQAEKVKKALAGKEVEFVYQNEQLGTGHAVMQAEQYIENHQGPVLVLCGDTPLLTAETLQKMVDLFQDKEAKAAVLTANLANPAGYGRVLRNNDATVKKIVEEKDATSEQKNVSEVNSGVYCFDSDLLAEALDNLDRNNQQKEYYLTDAVSYINDQGSRVIPVEMEHVEEMIGVNDRKNLARATNIFYQRINEKHLIDGVTIIDPDNTYIDQDVVIGQDSVIYPFTFLTGDTEIGRGTIVGPYCKIDCSQIGDNVQIKANCNINKSVIKKECQIGPFAYIRPGTKLESGVKVGDFVELKKAQIDEGTKVPHLSYVGDAIIGKKTNIGAGTIFANYDGKNKHQTQVGDFAFIGSNTTLVAPVSVGNKGKTGAGAVVTRDVSEETTVIGVPARVYEKGDKDS